MTTIRLTSAADKVPAAQLVQEFSDLVSGGRVAVIDPERLQNRFQRWPQVQAVYLDNGGVVRAYCELTVREARREAEFTGAFPRGAPRAIIGPVFAECARGVLAHYPARLQADVRTWRVWGQFLHGQDANRVPDSGRGICQAWVDYFAQYGKTVTARRPADRTLWIAEMLLGDLADHGGV